MVRTPEPPKPDAIGRVFGGLSVWAVFDFHTLSRSRGITACREPWTTSRGGLGQLARMQSMLVVQELQTTTNPTSSLTSWWFTTCCGVHPAPGEERSRDVGPCSKASILKFQGMHHPVPHPFCHYMVVRRLSAAPGPTIGSTRRHQRQQTSLEPPKHPSYGARSTCEYVKGKIWKMAF